MIADTKAIPKVLWLFWQQGKNEAPDTVIQCMRSWSELNPEWVVHTLAQDNIDQYIDLGKIVARNADRLTPQALSDIVRINLLRKYGGVWADATCFCCQPLDSWLNECTGSFCLGDSGGGAAGCMSLIDR